MDGNPKKNSIYLEIGTKRVFAGALDWPGWCRSGKDEEKAVRSLFEYRLRYECALKGADVDFHPAEEPGDLIIVERLKGDATTDFGSPGKAPQSDAKRMRTPDLERSAAILKACWREFDRQVNSAAGRELRKGSRGGGRDLDEIVRHMLEGDEANFGRIGWACKRDAGADPGAELRRTRAAILEGLAASAAGKLPAAGPRGGSRWTARYFVRRVAWHAQDHAWEIEDRV